jgi:hypothetical protein
MAINRLDFGTTPNPAAGDWALNAAILAKAFQNNYSPLQFNDTDILQGSTFQIGGIIYYTNSDTTITGTPSNYVKLTPNVGDSGATCDAAFVANLSGVTWNKIYNGYYDGSGNLYIFDEVRAILDSAIVGANTKFGELWENNAGQSLKPTDNVTFNNVILNDITANDIEVNNTIINGNLTIDNLPVPLYGAIGSFTIAASNVWSRSTEYAPNTTVAGNSLYRSTGLLSGGTRISSFGANGVSSMSISSTNWVNLSLTGTWRLLTNIKQYSASVNTEYVIGLLQRIS